VVLLTKFDWRFAAVTFVAVGDLHFFHRRVTSGAWTSAASQRADPRPIPAIDSLLNYETVSISQREYEARRYDDNCASTNRPR